MTEEQIRTIVRDEIELQATKPDGLLDQARHAAWIIARGMFEFHAEQMIKAYDRDKGGIKIPGTTEH